MNNKVALIGDVHINRHNIDVCNQCFNNLFRILKEQEVDRLYILGDLFDKRTSINGQSLDVLLCACNLFDKAYSNDTEIWYIAGNHDKTDLDSDISYIDVISGQKINCTDSLISIGALQFYKEEKYIQELAKIEPCKYLLSHQGVNGVINNDGSEHNSVITPNLFAKFDKVFMGHYHDAQFIAPNIYYIGAFIQHNFGEKYEDKGVTILDMKTGETEKFHCGGVRYVTRHIKPNEYFDTPLNLPDIRYRYVFEVEPKKSQIEALKAAGVKVIVTKNPQYIQSWDNEPNNYVNLPDYVLMNEIAEYCVERHIKEDRVKFLHKRLES